jgi:hypothetical protein
LTGPKEGATASGGRSCRLSPQGWKMCSASLESSHLSDFACPEFVRAPIAQCLWSKLVKLCCQTHSSFRLRKKRSMMPFCSGV